MFSIIKNNDAPKNIKRPEFVVDHEIKKNIAHPWPKQHSYLVFCAKSRSGKSTTLISLLTNNNLYKCAFHNVIVVMPRHSFTSIAEEDNPFMDLDPAKIFHELDFDVLSHIKDMLIGFAENEEDSLLLIDDMASELKNPKILRLFNSIINNRRHLRTSIWCSVQVYNSIPLSNRKTVNYLVLFKLNNKKEIKSIFDEMILGMSFEQFIDLLDYVFDKPFEYLIIDRDHNKYYKKFDEVVVHCEH